jgi:ElaB/YqjD/DUF883 family membrane-anchored ribosome-binding protein
VNTNELKDRAKDAINNTADKAKSATDAAANAADKAKQSGGGVMDSIRDEVKDVAHSVADFAHGAKDRLKEYAGEAGDTAKHAADKVQHWAGDAYDATAHAAGDFGKEVTALVRKYPVPALLVGFGIGMLLGRVSSV